MSQRLQMSSFVEIENLNIGFKKLLEDDFKLVYIEKKESLEEDNNEEPKNDLILFKIPKDRESIFKKITSLDKLDEVKKEFKSEYERFTDDFLDYFERVEGQLNETENKSFEIIEKTIKNRAKKLNGTIDKFKVEDSWGVSKLEEEFYFKLQKNLKDIVESLLPTISVGMKDNSAYEGVLSLLNKFLFQLGIYTKEFNIGESCNYELLTPQECDDCSTLDLDKKDVIKEILSYPYMIDDDKVVIEGKVILWKVEHNG